MLVKCGLHYFNVDYISAIIKDELHDRYTIYMIDDAQFDISEIELQSLVKRLLTEGYII